MWSSMEMFIYFSLLVAYWSNTKNMIRSNVFYNILMLSFSLKLSKRSSKLIIDFVLLLRCCTLSLAVFKHSRGSEPHLLMSLNALAQ
jgi:hypothetical protein